MQFKLRLIQVYLQCRQGVKGTMSVNLERSAPYFGSQSTFGGTRASVCVMLL